MIITFQIKDEALTSQHLVKQQQQWTYKPYTLVGPTVTSPVQDSLAVALLDIQLYNLKIFQHCFTLIETLKCAQINTF